jgi:hypothetical protein
LDLSGSVGRKEAKCSLRFGTRVAVARRRQRRLPVAGASTCGNSGQRQRRSGIKDEHVREAGDSVQIRWSAFLRLVIISTGDAEGDAMFAGGLRIVWVVPCAAHLASTAGVATCGGGRTAGGELSARK